MKRGFINSLKKVSLKSEFVRESINKELSMVSYIGKKGKMFDHIDVIRDQEYNNFANSILKK